MKSFAKFLPSKSFRGVLLSLLIIFVLIGTAYAISQRKSVRKEGLGAPILGITDNAQDQISKLAALKDSDNDGLKDWEEVLWKTDPKNADTDGDSTKDGDEVKNGRNPFLAGPNDRFIVPESGVSPNVTPEKLTPTDIIARDFFSKYAQAKQSGQPIDAVTQQQIASSVLAHQDLVVQARQYTEGDLLVNKINDSQSLKNYGNEVGEIMKKTLTWDAEELPIVNEALKNNNEKKLQELDPIIEGYQSFLDQLLKTEVPPKAVQTHLELLNSVNKIITSLKTFKEVFKDPVSALVLFGKYPDSITSLNVAFIDAKALFERNNVVYDPKDAGYIYAHFADAINAYGKK